MLSKYGIVKYCVASILAYLTNYNLCCSGVSDQNAPNQKHAITLILQSTFCNFKSVCPTKCSTGITFECLARGACSNHSVFYIVYDSHESIESSSCNVASIFRPDDLGK
jgi:hypothetical protein